MYCIELFESTIDAIYVTYASENLRVWVQTYLNGWASSV